MRLDQDATLHKIKLLFILDKMEIPLTEDNIVDICTGSNHWLSFFDLKEALLELCQVGFIFADKIENEVPRYSITYDGRNCLSHFYFRIPKDIREKITNYAQENRMNFKRSQEYVSEYILNTDGTYSVILKIKEPMHSSQLLEIKLKAPNRQSAIDASKKWQDKAPLVYESIFDSLLDG